MNTTTTATTTSTVLGNIFDNNNKLCFTTNDDNSYFDALNCLVNDNNNNLNLTPTATITNGLLSSSSSSSPSSSSNYHNYNDRRNYLNTQHQPQQQQQQMLAGNLDHTQVLSYDTNFLNMHYFNELTHKITTSTNSNIDNCINNNEIIDFSMKCDNNNNNNGNANNNNYEMTTPTVPNTNYHRSMQPPQQHDVYFSNGNNNNNNAFQLNHHHHHHSHRTHQQQLIQPNHLTHSQNQPHIQNHQQQQQLLRIDSPPPSILNGIMDDNNIIDDDDIDNIGDDEDDEDDEDILNNNNNGQQLYSKTQDHSAFDLMSYNNYLNVNTNTTTGTLVNPTTTTNMTANSGYDINNINRFNSNNNSSNVERTIPSYNHLAPPNHTHHTNNTNNNNTHIQHQNHNIHLQTQTLIQNEHLSGQNQTVINNLNISLSSNSSTTSNNHQNIFDSLNLDSFKSNTNSNGNKIYHSSSFTDANNVADGINAHKIARKDSLKSTDNFKANLIKGTKSTIATRNRIQCQVCGDKSSGFHFGVYTCEACKGFFRRCNKKSKLSSGPCSKRCTITKETRNNCTRCRFERCLAVGMAVEKIRFGKTPKHVANLIINATSRTNSNFLVNPTNLLTNSINTNYINNENHNYNQNFNINNQSVEKLLKSLISYLDSATHEYLSMIKKNHHHHHHQQQQQQHVNYNSQTTYNSINSNQNIINFSTKFPNDYQQQNQIYLTPSTSSSSLPQSASTSPYLHNNPQHQSSNIFFSYSTYAQELLWKLKQKVTNKLNEYLGETKKENIYNYEPSLNIKPENSDKILNKKYNTNDKEFFSSTSSFDNLFAAYLFLIVSDYKSKNENDCDKNSLSIIQNQTAASISSPSSSSSTTSTLLNNTQKYHADFDHNPITNSMNKNVLNNLQILLDRIYRNNTEDCNRVIKILHFILILLMQSYNPSMKPTVFNNKTNNELINDYNSYSTSSLTTTASINSNDDFYLNNNLLKLQKKIVAGLIDLKCRNHLTTRRILLSLDFFCDF